MNRYRVSVSSVIPAPASLIYNLIADYRNGHPQILPKPYFQSLEVESGGVGAGTTIRFQMRLFGTNKNYRAAVTEPEPGRMLVESNESGEVSTFTVDPLVGGQHAQVTIATDLPCRRWFGALERFFARLMLRRIYAKELALLAKVAGERARSVKPAGGYGNHTL
jgi:hypothetical protein